MTLIFLLILLVFLFAMPYFLVRWSRKYKLDKVVGDIVICYALGILIGNTRNWWLDSWLDPALVQNIHTSANETAKIVAFAAVLLAMPMLLMLNDVKSWIQYTGKISLSFVLGVLAALVASLSVGYWFKDSLENVATASGMMAGVYIGGTPNMVAVSKALGADDNLFIILNSTDTFCSGLYFFFLLSLAKPLFQWILPKFSSSNKDKLEPEDAKTEPLQPWKTNPKKELFLSIGKGVGLSILVISISVLLGLLIPDIKGELNQTVLWLSLTSIAIGLSFVKWIRQLKGIYEIAQYLLLVFGLAAGFMANFAELIDQGAAYLLFNALTLITIIALHLLLAKIFKIDTDSFIISSTATVLGPPFVAQVATSIKNKELLSAGIALALLGLAIANYCGVFVSALLA